MSAAMIRHIDIMSINISLYFNTQSTLTGSCTKWFLFRFFHKTSDIFTYGLYASKTDSVMIIYLIINKTILIVYLYIYGTIIYLTSRKCFSLRRIFLYFFFLDKNLHP